MNAFLMLSLSALLSGGGLHGVVVQKTFKPLPVVHSLGVGGIYRLEFRDEKNKVRRQMVSQEIFALYQVGDLFDDRLTPSEVRRHRVATQAAKVATPIAVAEQAKAQKPEVKPRVSAEPESTEKSTAQLTLRQDMLAETEGF